MASKDFMSPKVTNAPADTATNCAPKTFGAPVTPGQVTAENAAKSTQRPAVDTSTISNAGAGRGFVNPPFVKPDNAYVHESDNIVANSSSNGGTNSDKVKLNLEFMPNIMDNFDNVTYHFKLFITSPEVSSTGNVFNIEDQVIIAESGVTDLTIDNVEIKSVCAPSIEAGTGTATYFKFEIVEPSGAGMIDKIFYQSVALGIGNWAVMPVYLQLQFRGRNPETSAPDDGTPGSLSSLKWLWPIKISTIKATVTHVGTRYEFDAIYYNEFAQTNAGFTLQHNVTLNNIGTFGSAMAELQDKLNADQILKLMTSYSIPDSYKIVVDPKIAGYEITPHNKNTNSRRNDNFTEFENKDATFSHGVTIDKIIDSLLGQTSEYQKILYGSKTAGGAGETMNELPGQMKKFWRIITETRPLKFDPMRVDIAKEFTIFVVEYDIGLLDSITAQTSAPPVTLEAQRKRLMTYASKQILKKKYNYIFTGLNDQILNFDIVINNGYANAMARLNGIYSNPAMSDKGVVNHDHAREEKRVTDIISRAVSFQNNAKTASTNEATVAFNEAKSSIASADLPDATKSRYISLLEKSKPESRLNYLKEIQEAGGIDLDGRLNTTRYNAVMLSKPITEKVTQQQLNFISDIDITSSEATSAHTRFMENMRGKIRPVARYETMQDHQIGMGVESSSNSGIQKLSSVFSTALHSGLDSSFTNLTLTIKGDPYWITPQPYKDGEQRLFNSLRNPVDAIDWIKNAHFRYVDSVNIYGTDNFILVRFRTPRVFEGNSTEDMADVETLSGVYKVNFVTNKFSTGKFTQELVCIIDPEILVANITEQIEDNARQKDKAATTKDLFDNKNIPETAIKRLRVTDVSNASSDIGLPDIGLPKLPNIG